MEFDPLRTLIFGRMNLSRAERKFPNFFHRSVASCKYPAFLILRERSFSCYTENKTLFIDR